MQQIEKQNNVDENEAEIVQYERSEYPLLYAFKNILDFYFGDISLETIVNISATSSDGFTSELLIHACLDVGLISVEKNMNAEDIPSHFFPCIIFGKNNMPVVLLEKSKEVTFYDPVLNEKLTIKRSSLKEYKKAILIFREPKKAALIDMPRNKDWFWNPVKSFWRSYIEIALLTFFITLFALAVPLFTMSVYDRVVPNNATETLFVLAMGVLVILGFDMYFKSVRNHIIEKVGKQLGVYLEEELLKRMLSLKSQYDTMLVGSKANLFRELSQIRDFIATKSILQIVDLPFFFVSVTVIFIISPAVSLVPILTALFILAFNIIMQIPISNLSKKNLNNVHAKHSFLIETLQGSEIIKLSNANASKLFSWRKMIALTDTIALKIQSINVFAMNLSQSIVQLVTMLVIVVGVFEIANKNLSVGGLIAVTILASRAMVPIIQTSMMVIKFKEISESLNNINDFWHLPLENNKNMEIGVGKLKGEIEFSDVSFFYKDSKYASLESCNLKIKEGEKVGIIGQTGAGKTTFLRLLSGLDDCASGSIFLDGHEISTLHPVELRQNIGVMPQEPFLFSGTLKENIELSSPISKERMMQVIKLTGLDDLVKKSGQGAALQVGEGGSKLSVGQRHLVALSRAILQDPSIIILDEPTTGLDVGLEKTLITHMKKILEKKTLIVITHRFAALELVDRVIVLNNGKIVADGPKDSVLAALQNKN